MVATYDSAIGRFLAGEDRHHRSGLPEIVQMLLQGLTAPANLPFSRELWLADAAAWLAEVSVPVLIVIGKKDLQVDWQADGAPLQQAVAGRADVDFVFPENANHVQKYEPTPLELGPAAVGANYNAPGDNLDPDALTTILEWLAAHQHQPPRRKKRPVSRFVGVG